MISHMLIKGNPFSIMSDIFYP